MLFGCSSRGTRNLFEFWAVQTIINQKDNSTTTPVESRCQSGTGAYLCQIINENGSVTSEWEIWILFALEAIRLHHFRLHRYQSWNKNYKENNASCLHLLWEETMFEFREWLKNNMYTSTKPLGWDHGRVHELTGKIRTQVNQFTLFMHSKPTYDLDLSYHR